jgi:hypothetical protein
MSDVLSMCAMCATGEILRVVWDTVGGVPKARTRMLFAALIKSRRAEIVRLASAAKPTTVPRLSRPFEVERLILSMPVFLYESDSRRRLYQPASKAGRRLVWEHRASSGKLITISPVDHGTLRLTNRRFVFAGARRQREFPVDELTHLSTTWSSIALAARGCHGISYFTGLSASRLRFPVVPEEGDLWQAQAGSFNLRGADLKEILDIMNNPSPPALS